MIGSVTHVNHSDRLFFIFFSAVFVIEKLQQSTAKALLSSEICLFVSSQVVHGFVGFSESVSEKPNLCFGMDYARSNIIFLILCLVFAATFPDVEARKY